MPVGPAWGKGFGRNAFYWHLWEVLKNSELEQDRTNTTLLVRASATLPGREEDPRRLHRRFSHTAICSKCFEAGNDCTSSSTSPEDLDWYVTHLLEADSCLAQPKRHWPRYGVGLPVVKVGLKLRSPVYVKFVGP